MTEPQPVEKLIPRIFEKYTENPRGWHILNTPSGDMVVLGPDVSYQLRIIELSPSRYTGVGMEIESLEMPVEEISGTPEFGLRVLDEQDIRILAEALVGSSNMLPQVEEIVRRTPVSLAQIEHSDVKHILSGPVLSRPDLKCFSPSVIRRQYELERHAQRIFRERYPLRAGMYL